MLKHISIKDIKVKKYRILCLVKVYDKNMFSTPELKLKLLSVCPSLNLHMCKNAANDSFEKILDTTSLPHILEHLIIDIQVSKSENSAEFTQAKFLGTTKWVDKKNGLAEININYFDDIVALQAIKEAEDLLNHLLD